MWEGQQYRNEGREMRGRAGGAGERLFQRATEPLHVLLVRTGRFRARGSGVPALACFLKTAEGPSFHAARHLGVRAGEKRGVVRGKLCLIPLMATTIFFPLPLTCSVPQHCRGVPGGSDLPPYGSEVPGEGGKNGVKEPPRAL